LGATLIVALLCHLIGRFSLPSLPKPEFHVSKLFLLGLMILEVALALRHNSYWASAFLILPAWIWALVGCGPTLGKRLRNKIWILAAGIPYYAALWVYASRLGMHWNFLWYQVLALSTGMFSAAGYFLGAGALALGIRFLAIQSHESAV
jgi:hypothetical protein